LLITASPALAHPGHDDPVGLLAQLVHAVLGTEAGLVLLVAGSAALLGGMARRLRRVRRAAKAPAVARRAGKS
jgi:hydrogenase/urease accessory protein HupE